MYVRGLNWFSFLIKLTIEVEDGGVARRVRDPYFYSIGFLTVRVSRNIRAPTFIPSTYLFNIKETQPVGANMGAVTLRDPDGDVSIIWVAKTPDKVGIWG